MKRYELGVVIGRFQPLHLGHEKVIYEAIDACDRVAVYVGSAQESGTPRNPLDYKLRKAMVEMVFGDSADVFPLNDIGKGDSPSWGRYVLDTVKRDLGRLPDAVFLSEDGERSHWFDGIEDRPAEVYVDRAQNADGGRLSGSCIRRSMLDSGGYDGLDGALDPLFLKPAAIRSVLKNRILAANGRRALLVIDMQNDFVTGSLANPAAQAICSGIASLIENGGYQGIVYTKDTHRDDYPATSEGLALPIAHCRLGTIGFDVVPEIRRRLEDALATEERKPTFGDIRLSDLKEFSSAGAIDIVGTCTDICVISNALILKASFPEKEIRVFRDLCAGSSIEAHEAALKVMANCQITIADSKPRAKGEKR